MAEGLGDDAAVDDGILGFISSLLDDRQMDGGAEETTGTRRVVAVVGWRWSMNFCKQRLF